MQESKPLPPAEPHLCVRRLKIEAHGDFWKGLIKPKIRLMGRWLERAGFRPGSHVHVSCVAPGLIELRCLDVSSAHEDKPALSEQLTTTL